MSEQRRLKEEYHIKCNVYSQRLLRGFLEKLGKLQAECKHEKTHWMQELNPDGTFKEGLYKRCFICGSTVEVFCSATPEFIENILNDFDSSIESQRAWLSKKC